MSRTKTREPHKNLRALLTVAAVRFGDTFALALVVDDRFFKLSTRLSRRATRSDKYAERYESGEAHFLAERLKNYFIDAKQQQVKN